MPKQSTFIIIVRLCVRILWQYIFAIRQIRSYVIDFICNLDSRGLDTSLRINATLSMTNYCHKKKNAVILRAIARSIYFSDLNLKAIHGLYTNLKVIRHKFTHFGLLRRIYDSPRNDKSIYLVIARFGVSRIVAIHTHRHTEGDSPKQSKLKNIFNFLSQILVNQN